MELLRKEVITGAHAFPTIVFTIHFCNLTWQHRRSKGLGLQFDTRECLCLWTQVSTNPYLHAVGQLR